MVLGMKRLPDSVTFWLVVVLVVIAIGVALSIWKWEWMRLDSDGKVLESGSTTIRNLGFVIAGVIALIFAIWRSIVAQSQVDASRLQAETGQRGLLNERYQRGAEMLGHNTLSVRLGGVYALRLLAEEHPENYHVQVMNLLCAFVRYPMKDDSVPLYLENSQANHWETRILRADVQDAMAAIGSRSLEDIESENAGARPYLRDADIRGLQLLGTNLSNAHLTNVNLSDARIRRANLTGARLRQAILERTFLRDADLSNADIQGADFSDADLTDAILSGARFSNLGQNPAKGLTQAQLNRAIADPSNPPRLEGVTCAASGDPLYWNDGKSI